jgi:type I restriction enzyme S subunit
MSERVLGDLADLTVGHVGPMATEYVENGIPFLRSLNVRPFKIDLDGVKYISNDFHERLRKSALKPGDVVVVRTGLPGTAAVVPESLPVANCSDVVIVRPGPDLDSRYLAYLINSVARGYIDSRTVGAVQQHFNVGAAKGIPIPVATLEEQRRIATVLGSIEDLIESEERSASQADGLWRAVVASEPGASESLRLSSLASFVNGKNFTKGGGTTGLPVIRTPEVRSGPTASTVRNEIAAADENIALPGDILFVWSGSLLVSRWQWQPGLVNQHIFKVIPAADIPDWLVLWSIEALMEDFLGVAEDKATTMGHIKRGDLDRPVAVPDRSRWSRLDTIVRPLWDEALQARLHAADLARTRDELLPLLMSGKVRVSEGMAVA